MSAYTTLTYTRKAAIEEIVREKLRKKEQKLLEKYSRFSDSELEAFLDDALRPRLFNGIIVPDEVEDKDAWGGYVIR